MSLQFFLLPQLPIISLLVGKSPAWQQEVD